MKFKKGEIDFYVEQLESANNLIDSFEFPLTSKAISDLIKKLKAENKGKK